MQRIILIVVLLLWTNSYLRSQCNESLVQKATEQVGKDAVLVRDFKVKLKEASRKNPSPSSHFSVLMQKDITYRFNLLNAVEFDGKAMLQLYDKSNMLGSTYNENAGTFQYKCPRTGNYQVLITFVDGKAGCAAGIMSMVLDSSMQNKTASETEEVEILYLDMENPLQIITDLSKDEKIDISVDNGKIIRKDTNIFVIADHEGKAKVNVKVINAEGKITSEVVKDFNVYPLSAPKASLEKAKDEYINLADLTDINKIQVEPWAYKVLHFCLSKSRIPNSGLASNSEFLTHEQREFLRELTVNDRFYVGDIQVELPNGKVVTIEPLEYKIR
jgi:hypothetical protein